MVSCPGRMLLLALVALSLVVERSPVLAFDDLFDDILSYFYDSESESSDSVEVISAGNKNVSIIVKCENCTVSLACDKCASMTTAAMGMMEPTTLSPVTPPSTTTTTTTTVAAATTTTAATTTAAAAAAAAAATTAAMDTPNSPAPGAMDDAAVASDAPPADTMGGTGANDSSTPDSNAENENTVTTAP